MIALPHVPEPSQRPDRPSGIVLQVIGGTVTAVATMAAFVATAIASLNSMYCATTAPPEAQASLTRTNAIITICWVAVPALFAYLTARRQLRWVPWIVIASVAATIGIYITVMAVPARFCVF